MSEKLNKKVLFAVIGIAAVVVLCIAFCVSCGTKTESTGNEPSRNTVTGSEQGEADGNKNGQQTGEAGKDGANSSDGNGQVNGEGQTKADATPAPGTPNATPKPDGSKDADEGNNPQTPSIDITKADAPYEKWLAAGMILGASMQYPDFEFEAVYITGEHDLKDRTSSEGAYLQIKTGGETVLLESKPLSEERTEEGTLDLYTGDLGFNTYDAIAADSIDLAALTEISVESLSELINQSILVTIYEH